jgi:cytochrome c oxidase subunit II
MRRTVAIAALALLPLAACGGDDDEASGTPGDNAEDGSGSPSGTEGASGGGGGGAVTVVGEDIQWTEDGYSAAAGEVSFVLENRDNVRHTLVIDGVSEDEFKLEVDGEGDTDEGSTQLEAGDYEIFCDVPGHSSMRATLTVE